MHSARLSQKKHPNSRGSSGPAERGLWGQSHDSGGQWEVWTVPESAFTTRFHPRTRWRRLVPVTPGGLWRGAPSCAPSCPQEAAPAPDTSQPAGEDTHSPTLAWSAQCPQCESTLSPRCQLDAFSPPWDPGSAPSSLSEAGRPRSSLLTQAPKPICLLTNLLTSTHHGSVPTH